MRGTSLALVTASILSLLACGGDDSSSTVGGSGTGGTGGAAGSTSTGGSAGKGGTSGSAGTGGSSGTGGQGGTTPGDASPPIDVRADSPPGTTDAPADRPGTTDGRADGGSAGDATVDQNPIPDGSTTDTSSPPDGGQSDTTPPTDGGSGDGAADAPAGDGSSTMVLTSTGFVEGAMIPADFTCAGTNVSPPLQWTPGPSGTMSYAVVFTDRTPNAVLIHSIIYDIPANVTSLPMNVEKVANPSTPAGAKQVRAYDNATYGYLGPCPNGQLHNYEFSVRAIDVAALPGVMTTSTRTIVEPVVTMHTLASGLLNGQSSAKKGP